MDDRRLRWQHMFILANIIFTGHWLRGHSRVEGPVKLLGEINFLDSTIILVSPLERVGRLRRRLHHHGVYVAIIRQRRKGISWLIRSISVGILTAYWVLKEWWLAWVI